MSYKTSSLKGKPEIKRSVPLDYCLYVAAYEVKPAERLIHNVPLLLITMAPTAQKLSFILKSIPRMESQRLNTLPRLHETKHICLTLDFRLVATYDTTYIV